MPTKEHTGTYFKLNFLKPSAYTQLSFRVWNPKK